MTEFRFEIEGLDDFRRDLRRLSKDAPKAMTRAGKRAAQLVAPRVQAAYARRYRQRSGRGARSIRAVATQRGAGVRIGGARAPYVVGQEFGSNKYRQFAPWSGPSASGRGSAGKFLYPTIRGLDDEILAFYAKELDVELVKVFREQSR